MTETSVAVTTSQAAPSQIPREIQLRYEVAASTFKLLCEIKRSPSASDILRRACSATEFGSFPINKGEAAFFRAINDNTGIPYQVKEFISQPWHKVFLLVQVDLLKSGWPNKLSGPARQNIHKELGRMYKLLDRVLRCLVDILGEKGDGKGVRTALDVLRSVKAGVWEKSDNQLLQVEGIGQINRDKLIRANIKSIKQLAALEFYHIERILSRNPPYGQSILHKVSGFPALTLDFEIISQYTPDTTATSQASSSQCETNQPTINTSPASQSLWIARAVLGFTNEKIPHWQARTPWLTLVVEGADGRLIWFWRGSAKKLVNEKEIVIGLSAKSNEQLKVVFACEEIVGTMIEIIKSSAPVFTIAWSLDD
ncbi:DNA RNA helicase [Fusarium heterosporum]|uniref:DNA RNA helicase n=1 Tax=Fusarium heterosporum TaxID=42747 RepID=A0A8H5TR57_FUSHE|nr:DNA RNA helicase [Fusarium heterosporum]